MICTGLLNVAGKKGFKNHWIMPLKGWGSWSSVREHFAKFTGGMTRWETGGMGLLAQTWWIIKGAIHDRAHIAPHFMYWKQMLLLPRLMTAPLPVSFLVQEWILAFIPLLSVTEIMQELKETMNFIPKLPLDLLTFRIGGKWPALVFVGRLSSGSLRLTTVISLLSFQGFYASQWAGFTLQAQRLLHTGVATWRGLWRLEREQPER